MKNVKKEDTGGDVMVDKRSPYYLKSEFEESYTGTENSTTYERELKVDGTTDQVRFGAPCIKAKLMP